ncbi:MAG: hypothetical protein KGJ23_04785 [Euryarchaeota archaeon]|nr:hypothetical protein [Euryarchaeota archaeon]MDE1835915.1 hypothetical protein [Euryarchaeota archaeon]MDE1880210.1 hypothetical protein [Euryarchaeota archaeon]MDE2044407.1 hypothetical protein [Thermoplasmata archaeon]
MMAPVKARTGHIVIDGKKDFRELTRVYPEIHRRVVEANRPFLREPDQLMPEILLEENLRDIKSGRKPSGFNRQEAAGMRLIFPIREDRKVEFYVSRPSRCQEVVQLTESISTVLKKAGLKHKVEYDRLPNSVRGGSSGGYSVEPTTSS